MSQKFKQHDKRFRIATLLGEEQLHLRSLQGEELLSGLFHFRLEMVSEDLRLDFRRLVGKPLTLTMELAEGERRHVNGIVSRFVQSGGFEQDGAFFTTYHADLHPTLWFLTLGRDCRIFQQKTVPEILEAVLDAHGVTDRELKLNGQYEPRDYCVQYGESPFAFLSRLMEEEGIFYYFVHEFDKHTLVIADDPAVFVPGPGAESLRCGTLKSAQTLNLVPRCSLEERVIPGSFYVDDFSFETPYTDLLAREQSALPWSEGRSLVYEYPGRFTKKDEGERLARMRIEELEAQAKVLSGDCLSPSLSAGHRFTLEEHYRDDVNGPYVLQKVTHTATSGEYTNRFEAFPATAPFKPPRRTRKPIIPGTQTAIIVGKEGEEIWTDEHGRVKVQFHWDQEGTFDEKSSCWVRVSQGWAGKGWGQIFLPRIGQEVIVSFEEGDPDRPLITGRVYNAEQPVPYELPAEQTKSGTKSRSSKGGGGFNEIRFEDKKGEEEVFIHAQKDQRTVVENDQYLLVKGDRYEEVVGQTFRKIKAFDTSPPKENSSQASQASPAGQTSFSQLQQGEAEDVEKDARNNYYDRAVANATTTRDSAQKDRELAAKLYEAVKAREAYRGDSSKHEAYLKALSALRKSKDATKGDLTADNTSEIKGAEEAFGIIDNKGNPQETAESTKTDLDNKEVALLEAEDKLAAAESARTAYKGAEAKAEADRETEATAGPAGKVGGIALPGFGKWDYTVGAKHSAVTGILNDHCIGAFRCFGVMGTNIEYFLGNRFEISYANQINYGSGEWTSYQKEIEDWSTGSATRTAKSKIILQVAQFTKKSPGRIVAAMIIVVVVTLATPFFKLLKPSKTANVVIACLLATIVVLLSVALFFWTRSLKLKGPKNRHKNTKIEMDTHSISLDVMNPVVPALQVVSNVPGAQAVPGAQTVPARIFADESYASMECPFDPDNGGRPTGGAKVRVGADNSAFLTVGDGGFFAERNEVRMVAPVAARAFTKEVLTARRTELEQIEGMPVTREVSVANETVSLRSADRRKLKEDARAEFDRRMPTTQTSANIRINQQGITLDGQMVELG